MKLLRRQGLRHGSASKQNSTLDGRGAENSMARLRWHPLASHMPLTCFSHASHMLLTLHPFDANFLVLCSPSDVGSSAHTYDKSDRCQHGKISRPQLKNSCALMPEKLPSSPLNICDKLDAKTKNVSIATQEMQHGDARKARVLAAAQIEIYYYSHTSARNMDVAVFKLIRPLFGRSRGCCSF